MLEHVKAVGPARIHTKLEDTPEYVYMVDDQLEYFQDSKQHRGILFTATALKNHVRPHATIRSVRRLSGRAGSQKSRLLGEAGPTNVSPVGA